MLNYLTVKRRLDHAKTWLLTFKIATDKHLDTEIAVMWPLEYFMMVQNSTSVKAWRKNDVHDRYDYILRHDETLRHCSMYLSARREALASRLTLYTSSTEPRRLN